MKKGKPFLVPYLCRDMKKFSHVLFDLDGTLTDNTLGIVNAVQHTVDTLKLKGYNGTLPEGFIGMPIQEGFKSFFSLNGYSPQYVVDNFREFYSQHGVLENNPYPGIYGMLNKLYSEGTKLYVATAKLEKYAIEICEHFGFDKYLTEIKGADYNGKNANKSTIIADLLKSQQLTPSKEIAMVGDTVFDIEGGKKHGLSTVAVSYGFGKRETLQNAQPDFWADDVCELQFLLGCKN